jgi:hypothetical protein
MRSEDLKFDRKRTRVKHCPCGKKNRDGKFVPYIGFEKKGYCHSCGETFLPELKKEQNPIKLNFTKPKITSYHDPCLLSQCGRNFDKNNFIQYLLSVFDKQQVQTAILKYLIGTSKFWNGATIFWQVDSHNNIRHGKVMLYDSITGKRSKNDKGNAYINSVRSILKLDHFNLKQCIFGLHLINENRINKIAIVEGEKTAIIMSILKPDYIWMATGGKQGFNYEILKPIRTYQIIAFPDKGEYNIWLETARKLNATGFNISVDYWIENQTNLPKGTDLADCLIQNNEHRQHHTAKETKASKNSIGVVSDTDKKVNRLAMSNTAIWSLIYVFDLVDPYGNSIQEI